VVIGVSGRVSATTAEDADVLALIAGAGESLDAFRLREDATLVGGAITVPALANGDEYEQRQANDDPDHGVQDGDAYQVTFAPVESVSVA
jgi:hypothetical protein